MPKLGKRSISICPNPHKGRIRIVDAARAGGHVGKGAVDRPSSAHAFIAFVGEK
jgi:hypothetical protein